MQNVATLVVLRNADCLMECGNEFEITLLVERLQGAA